MVADTGISWAKLGLDRGSTWNPTYGCAVCSPGCKNCYAMRMAGRFSFPGAPYEGLVTIGKNKKAVWNGKGFLQPEALQQPLRWREPRGIFVDSMSDLFFEPITNEEIAACFGVMAAARQHRYLALTKRADRMWDWFMWAAQKKLPLITIPYSPRLVCHVEADKIINPDPDHKVRELGTVAEPRMWPLPHVWVGVSVDTRKHGLPRIEKLRGIPAAVRVLSIEPLLEDLGELDLTGIHWVIIGCESGDGARVCNPQWVRNIIRQCRQQGVPIWLKQLEHTPGKFISHNARGEKCSATLEVGADTGSKTKQRGPAGGQIVELPYLDGVQYAEWPNAVGGELAVA